MMISSAVVGADTDTELEVREYPEVIEIRLRTPTTTRLGARKAPPVRVWVDGREVTA